MELILADVNGREIKEIINPSFDVEISADESTFALSVPYNEWDGSINYGMRLYVPDTEFGGIIGEIYSDTSTNIITVSGRTWRGMLSKKIIMPPSGQTYKTVSGDVNTIIASLINSEFGGVIYSNGSLSGKTVTNYKFDRFCTVLEGIEKMLSSVGRKIVITFKQGTNPGSANGMAIVSSEAVFDYSEKIEISQDNQINFSIDDIRNGVNHLVIGGKGEGTARNIVHLYLQKDGSYSQTNKYYTGLNEIVEFYENTSTETSDLLNSAYEKMAEIQNRKEMSMDVSNINIGSICMGDIVGGRDYITGISMSAYITGITLTINGDTVTKRYSLEDKK